MAYSLYGHHSVVFALKNPERHCKELWVTTSALQKLQQDIPQLEKYVAKIQVLDGVKIDAKYPNAVHQGCVLVCEPLNTIPLETFLTELTVPKATLLILDNVTDPQNVGAIVRTAAALNVDGMIVHDRHSPPNHTPSLVKAASGGVEMLPLMRVGNIVQAMDLLKEHDFWCIGLSEHASQSLDKLPHYDRTALVLGSEGKGMRSLVSQHCDAHIRLPTNPQFPTLNVSVAAALGLMMMKRT